MVKVSILYPSKEDGRFDLDYYLTKHMPMAIEKLNPALKGVAVGYGLSGGLLGSPPPYLAMCDLLFDSLETFLAAFGTHAEALRGDIPNYTNIEPIIQISEIKLSQ